jgi:hypothetical protein
MIVVRPVAVVPAAVTVLAVLSSCRRRYSRHTFRTHRSRSPRSSRHSLSRRSSRRSRVAGTAGLRRAIYMEPISINTLKPFCSLTEENTHAERDVCKDKSNGISRCEWDHVKSSRYLDLPGCKRSSTPPPRGGHHRIYFFKTRKENPLHNLEGDTMYLYPAYYL